MAGSSLLALLDDIASILDDVSVMTKIATKKTVGVLGDDLALNAQQVTGVKASRELPVVWAVGVGSFRNKAILVPAALAISAFIPWAITPLLMIGGAFLCFEGFEKLMHKFFADHEAEKHHRAEHIEAILDSKDDVLAVEQEKIKGAIRTDFILSAEIIAITLGTVAEADFVRQILVLSGIAILMTVGVYGLVAGIVKLDDAGLMLSKAQGSGPLARLKRSLGRGVLRSAPYLMKTLSIAGTIAMFLVGGGILTHGIPGAHDLIYGAAHFMTELPAVGGVLGALTPTLLDGAAGVVAGGIVFAGVTAVGSIRNRQSSQSSQWP